MTAALYECQYCAYYSRETYAPSGKPVFVGTRATVEAHADRHPLGDPADYPRRIN